jgi:hypothetical protein
VQRVELQIPALLAARGESLGVVPGVQKDHDRDDPLGLEELGEIQAVAREAMDSRG